MEVQQQVQDTFWDNGRMRRLEAENEYLTGLLNRVLRHINRYFALQRHPNVSAGALCSARLKIQTAVEQIERQIGGHR
jgi:hypothetical protein